MQRTPTNSSTALGRLAEVLLVVVQINLRTPRGLLCLLRDHVHQDILMAP